MDIHVERTPLLTKEGAQMIRHLREHADAPQFNYVTGDRLHPGDMRSMEAFREALRSQRMPRTNVPPGEIVEKFETLRNTVPYLRRILSSNVDLSNGWDSLPTTSRLEIALRPWEFVPDDQPLDRLIVYRTAGTTGHPISVPHHPTAVRCYEPLLEYALERHGVKSDFCARDVACFLVGSQIRTYTYATVLYNWRGAGFAKLNIRQDQWPLEGSQSRYFRDMAPRFLSGDPIAFAEMLRMEIPAAPSALVTTSVAMSKKLRARLSRPYKAPVIDWYSMVETGPIGYACPLGYGYHLLPHDLHVDVLAPDGAPSAAGQRGEITLTGGRNPMMPLFRYRTGDYGILDYVRCPCGDPMPRFMELEGRSPVLIRSMDGTPVSTVDISRILREFPLLLHEFTQNKDCSCELIVRPIPGENVDLPAIKFRLQQILGILPVALRIDVELGNRREGKAIPYRSSLMLED